MSPVCKKVSNWRLNVDQKVKVVLFYAETKSVVATQRRFRAHFVTRWAPCKQTVYRPLGTIFQPIRINSVPDGKCFLTVNVCYVCNQWYDISSTTLYTFSLIIFSDIPPTNYQLLNHNSNRSVLRIACH